MLVARPLALVSLFAVVGCGHAPADDAESTAVVAQPITAGQTASAAGYGGIGMVFSNPTHVCTGFLISSNVVITAAHCFDGGRQPVAFYTGLGAPVANPSSVPTIPGLVNHAIKASGRHPSAVTTPADFASGTYPWKFDVAYVVLQTPTSLPTLPYGEVPNGTTSCTAVGYGTDAITNGGGTGGVRRQGTVNASPSASGFGYSLLNGSPGPNLANRGDSGGPLLCNGKVAGVFSVLHWDQANVVVSNVHVGTNGTVKTWLDGLVTTFAPPPPGGGAPDGGASGGSTDGGAAASDAGTKPGAAPGADGTTGSDDGPGGSAGGGAAPSAPPAPGATAEEEAPGGCMLATPRRANATGALGAALFALALLRRRRKGTSRTEVSARRHAG